MTKEQMAQLSLGDAIRDEATGNTYMVTGNYKGDVIATRIIVLDQRVNPVHWKLISKVERRVSLV